MTVWTIQNKKIYDIIQQNGQFTVSEEFIDKDFILAYKWLIKQMNAKIGHSSKENTYPIWAWHTWNWKHKKPDLRSSCFGRKGEQMVCMELEIPDDEILLSDFDNWHFVLNNTYFGKNCESDEDWNKECDFLNTLSEKDKQKVIEKSWEDIFDIKPYESEWQVRGRYIQGTFWNLKKEYIKKVQFFKNR